MAYFDSPKNRALWDRDLLGLRQERTRREANGFQPTDRLEPTQEVEHNPYRKPITLEQLQEAMNQTHSKKKPVRPQKTHEAPSIEGATRVPRPKRPTGD